MARRITDTLFKEELIVPDVEPDALTEKIDHILYQELSVEDRLNDEVRQILDRHEGAIGRGMDYRKLFDMTKQKLVKERGIVI